MALPLWCLMRESTAQAAGLQAPGQASSRHATHAQEPEWFTTAPVGRHTEGSRRKRAGQVGDVDLWEINEAFAVRAHGPDG